jgi:hypothetical protein
MWRDFSRVVRELCRIDGEGSGSYRPDLHYMRGPGPKWHAKHAGFRAARRLSAPRVTHRTEGVSLIRSTRLFCPSRYETART